MDPVRALQERAKELQCLYAIDSAICDRSQSPARLFERVLEELPAGWQDPQTTDAEIQYLGRRFSSGGFEHEGHIQSEPIGPWGNPVGHVSVSRRRSKVMAEADPFLPEEGELLRRVASRISEFLEWKHAELLGGRSAIVSTHWAWRQRFAEALADSLDAGRFGVSRMYLGGSTARGDAGPASDIDVYIRCVGSDQQRAALEAWLDGWSHCLAEVALQQTGQPFPGGILNVQWLKEEPGVWQRGELQELKLRTPAPP